MSCNDTADVITQNTELLLRSFFSSHDNGKGRESKIPCSENQFDLAASNERITDVRFLKPSPRFKSPRWYASQNKTKIRWASEWATRWILFRIPSDHKIEESNTEVNFIAIGRIGFHSATYFLISMSFIISLMNIPLEFCLDVGIKCNKRYCTCTTNIRCLDIQFVGSDLCQGMLSGPPRASWIVLKQPATFIWF